MITLLECIKVTETSVAFVEHKHIHVSITHRNIWKYEI